MCNTVKSGKPITGCDAKQVIFFSAPIDPGLFSTFGTDFLFL